MDKWFNNSWVIKGISLFIAVLLFLMVNADNQSTTPGGIPGISSGNRVLEEVPLNVYYDEDNHVVTEAAESVQVTLSGPQNLITVLLLERTAYELFVDLRGKEPGEYYEQVKYKGFPNELSVSIFPDTVKVTIQEKQTASFPVQVDLVNEAEVEEGYSIGTPIVTPANVDITAASGIIDQISSVRAEVDVSERNATFEDVVRVAVYDHDGNEMNVNTDPPAVDVNIPITSPNIEVPVRVEREGELPAGIAIESITTDPVEVTVYGPVAVINDISFIDVLQLDLSTITEDTTMEVEVPVPEGTERVSPETILVNIDVTEEEIKQFEDFEVDVIGLSEDFNYTFINPEEGVMDLEILGSPTVLERVERSALQLFIDLEGLLEGEHEVPLQFSGPQNVRIDRANFNAQIRIVSKDEEESELDEDTDTEETDEEVDRDTL